MRGYRTEAEVVELKQETDLDGDLITVAVYRFTLSGGEEHRFKRPVNSSIAGQMGAIQVGAKFDIFVDPNNPLNFIWRILMSRNTRCKSLNRCLAFKTRIATSSTNTSKVRKQRLVHAAVEKPETQKVDVVVLCHHLYNDTDSLCYPDGNHCPPGAEHAPRPH